MEVSSSGIPSPRTRTGNTSRSSSQSSSPAGIKMAFREYSNSLSSCVRHSLLSKFQCLWSDQDASGATGITHLVTERIQLRGRWPARLCHQRPADRASREPRPLHSVWACGRPDHAFYRGEGMLSELSALDASLKRIPGPRQTPCLWVSGFPCRTRTRERRDCTDHRRRDNPPTGPPYPSRAHVRPRSGTEWGHHPPEGTVQCGG